MTRALMVASGRELFGFDVTEVREVLKAPVLHSVPLAPPGLMGAINVHDTVVPVYDLGYLRGCPERACGQVVVLQQTGLALAVGAVHGLSSRSLAMPGGLRHRWVREMFISSHGLAGLVDPAVLLQNIEQELTFSRSGSASGFSERIDG